MVHIGVPFFVGAAFLLENYLKILGPFKTIRARISYIEQKQVVWTQ